MKHTHHSLSGRCRFGRQDAAQFVVHVNLDDFAERGFSLEAHVAGTGSVEVAWPSGDDSGDCLVGLTSDVGDGSVTRDRAQRRDLVAYGG